ncbi:MAG: box helicase, partial [Actinomycetota bacterium]|nr:box helicase [Actinomycetota bacterium]
GAAGQVVTIATLDQVAEVRMLLRKAGVSATWEGIPVRAGEQTASAAVSPRSSTRSSAPRSGGRPRSQARHGGRGR